ncbi:MAG: (d)CMP kinase [bacterium]|nr:(d)CMP kinase [bacterium]
MKLPNIAIDGPAASGKTTVARLLARRLGLVFLDTGAMYRAVAWLALKNSADLSNDGALTDLAENCDMRIKPDDGELGYALELNGLDITARLHEPRIDQNVSAVAKVSGVRRNLVQRQQKMAENGGVIMVGRDITTVVMPEAEFRYYLDASVEERARRRYLELQQQGESITEAEVLEQLKERDYIDSHRSDSPLYLAEGVRRFDSTGKTIDEVVEGLSQECLQLLKGIG